MSDATALRFTRVRARSAAGWWLGSFAAASAAAGLGRAVTTSYLPLLLERIRDAPLLIGATMLVNAAAGFAVPLAVGVWADRRRRRGHGAAIPLIVAGSWLTAVGLAAIALGSASSYALLALLALATYTGLNTVTTAHRALVREAFDATHWASATSAQELALLLGGLAGVAAGGAAFELAPWAPFALASLAVLALAAPTARAVREPQLELGDAVIPHTPPLTYLARLTTRPGVRAFIAAEVLWVLGYAALPTFFLLYADNALHVSPARASTWLAGFGIATGIAVAAAGRTRNTALYRPLLMVGLLLMGGGFAAMALASSLMSLTPPLLAAGIGFGIVSTSGFAAFATLVPEAEAGAYTAVFLSARAIGSALALPLVGLLIELSGSYRTLFVFGAIATLASIVPLAATGARSPRS